MLIAVAICVTGALIWLGSSRTAAHAFDRGSAPKYDAPLIASPYAKSQSSMNTRCNDSTDGPSTRTCVSRHGDSGPRSFTSWSRSHRIVEASDELASM